MKDSRMERESMCGRECERETETEIKRMERVKEGGDRERGEECESNRCVCVCVCLLEMFSSSQDHF